MGNLSRILIREPVIREGDGARRDLMVQVTAGIAKKLVEGGLPLSERSPLLLGQHRLEEFLDHTKMFVKK
jgi:hypothetical protein